MTLDKADRLLAGVVLSVIGVAGLVYRLTSCVSDIGELNKLVFYGGGYTILSLSITVIFLIVVTMGLYLIYTVIKKI